MDGPVHSVAISQPMLLPWIGWFEMLRLADTFVIYDDVQMPMGRPRGFINRVQVKTGAGLRWLSIPVVHQGKATIGQARIDGHLPWRRKHVETIRQAYRHAPFADQMLALAEEIYATDTDSLLEFDMAGIAIVCAFLGLTPNLVRSSELGTTTHRSQKVLDTVRAVGGTRYISGHGAINYLDQPAFAEAGI